jgi:LmeA-like phospholipid-binding
VTQENQGLGEQALNKAAEVGLASQLDEVENLEVNLKTDPLKLVSGEVDSVTIEGEGMVMQGDLRVEELEMEMSGVAINPLSAAFGKIELTKPTQGSASIVLTEADINRAFNSEYVRERLQKSQINIDGQSMTVIPQQVEFHLPEPGKVALKAAVLLRETKELEKVAFTAIPEVSADGKTVTLKDVRYDEEKEISPELTKALVDETSEILNLSNFDLEGMSLKINDLKIEANRLIIQAQAYVEQIPS